MRRPGITWAETFLMAGALWLFVALGLDAGPARGAAAAVCLATLAIGVGLVVIRVLSILADCLVDTVRPDRDLTDL